MLLPADVPADVSACLQDLNMYLVSELCRTSLARVLMLSRTNAPPIGRRARWGLEVCYGMTCLHAAGIVHRDLKIDNVRASPVLQQR